MADRFRRPSQPNDTSSESSSRSLLEQLRPIGSFFREHPAIAGTLLYLQVTTVGVVYSWQLFRRFGINVFDYAEANDFLLAAFKDPFVFGMSTFSIIAVLVATIIGYLQRTARRPEPSKTPVDETSATYLAYRMMRLIRYRVARPMNRYRLIVLSVFTIFYTLVPPLLFAARTADSLQSSSYEPLTSVQYRATLGSEEQTTEKDLRVIGTTQSFVFFYDKKENRTLIIPNAQIVEMKQSVTTD
jgi:hypothetical protein